MRNDLTVSEAIADPLIVQLLQADHVPTAAFAQLLQSAARVQLAQLRRVQADLADGAPRVDLRAQPSADRIGLS